MPRGCHVARWSRTRLLVNRPPFATKRCPSILDERTRAMPRRIQRGGRRREEISLVTVRCFPPNGSLHRPTGILVRLTVSLYIYATRLYYIYIYIYWVDRNARNISRMAKGEMKRKFSVTAN